MHHSRLSLFWVALILTVSQGSDSLLVEFDPEGDFGSVKVDNGIQNWRSNSAADGRLRAVLNLRSIERSESTGEIQVVWDNNQAYRVMVDSVILFGENDFSRLVNKKLTEPYKNIPASSQTLAEVQSKFNNYSFLEKSDMPYYARYEEDQVALLIPIKHLIKNSYSGIIGYHRDSKGSGRLMGNISTRFENLFGYCTSTEVNWKRKDNRSQHFSVREKLPIIPWVNFGLSLGLQQSLQDGLFIKRAADFGLRLNSVRFGRVSMGASQSVTSLTDLGRKAGLDPYRHNSVILNHSLGSVDRLGYKPKDFFYTASLQVGELIINNDLREILTVGTLRGEWVKSIINDWNIFIATRAGRAMVSGGKSIPAGERFRYGGAATLRGYREEVFISDWMIIQQLELRYELGQNVRFYTFMDGAVSDNNKLPFAVGIGLNQPTALGMLSLEYAISREDKLSRGKIHMRISGILP